MEVMTFRCARRIPVPFDHVYHIVRSHTGLADRDVRITHLVLAEHRLDFVVVDVRERDGVRDGDTALVLPAYSDVWWLLVEPDTESFELGLDDSFVPEWFENIEHDEDQITCSRDWRTA